MMQMSDYDVEVVRTLSAPPDRVYQAFVVPSHFARWYGPEGFPVDPGSIEIDARVGGRQRFDMVSEVDPSMRTGFDGRFTEVVENTLLASTGAWDGIPGRSEPWSSGLRMEFSEDAGKTRLVLREGPHPPGTADLGRQAWDVMLSKLEALVG